MKIKAYQIAPEYQESPLSLFDEWMEGLEIFGNKNYIRRTSETFDKVLECLDYGDFSDFGFTGQKADRLEELCNKYGTRGADNLMLQAITEVYTIHCKRAFYND